jgi:predicted AlkP superfamily phosphohydrolase/phosphomutase
MTSPAKVLVVGLDGATWKILNPLIEKGLLPNLEKIKRNFSSGILKSTVPSISAAAWSSFQTGVNPGKHGVYNFYERRTNPSNPPLISSKSIKSPKITDLFTKYSIPFCMINLPVSYPIEHRFGYHISSFLTPKDATDYVFPVALRSKVAKYKYRIDTQYENSFPKLPQNQFTPDQVRLIIEDVKSVIKARKLVFLDVLHETQHDFYFIYFKCTDFIQHLFYDTTPAQVIWMYLDKVVGQMVSEFNSTYKNNAHSFIISDHGFHPTAKKAFSSLLWLQEFFQLPSTKAQKTWTLLSKVNQIIKTAGINTANISVIKNVRLSVLNQLESGVPDENITFLPTIEGLYLFKHFRSKTYIDRLVSELNLLSDGKEKVFSKVAPATTVYHGPYLNEAPDIVWIFNPHYTLNFSPTANKIIEPTHPNLMGEHFSDAEGILVYQGPTTIKKSLNAGIEDLLPTFLKLFDLPLPLNLDGKPIKQIIKRKSPFKYKLSKSIDVVNRIEI